MRLTYRAPHPITREEAEAAFASNEPEQIADALVNVAFYDPDWRWVQDICLDLARSKTAFVRMVAAICLGHVARIHRQLDVANVAPVLRKLLADPDVYVRGAAEDAIGDVRIFMQVVIPNE